MAASKSIAAYLVTLGSASAVCRTVGLALERKEVGVLCPGWPVCPPWARSTRSSKSLSMAIGWQSKCRASWVYSRLPARDDDARTPSRSRLNLKIVHQAHSSRKPQSQPRAGAPTIRHGAMNIRDAGTFIFEYQSYAPLCACSHHFPRESSATPVNKRVAGEFARSRDQHGLTRARVPEPPGELPYHLAARDHVYTLSEWKRA